MTQHRPSAVVAVVSAVAVLIAGAAGPSPPDSLHAFLRARAAFSDAELAALGRGQPITKSLPAKDTREIAILGAVLIQAEPQHFLDRYRDIVAFRSGVMVAQIGTFSRPAVIEDLRALTLDAQDIRDLQKCKVGDCKVRLPASGIQRFQRDVDWRATDAGAQTNAIMRDVLCERARAYQAAGQSALGEYADRRPTVSLADELAPLLGRSPYVIEYVPEFQAYLREFPNATLPGAEDFMYWEQASFGLKPVVSVTHVTIHTRTTEGRSVTLIAAKQLYASHYFDASLGLTTVIDGAEAGTFYLVYLNRSLVTRLGGVFGGVIRSRVQSRVRDGMGKGLRAMKDRLENSGRPARSEGEPPERTVYEKRSF